MTLTIEPIAPATGRLLTAIKTRWEQRELDSLFTSISRENALKGSTRPYCVVKTISDVPRQRTNKNQYDDVRITVGVADETPEAADEKLAYVIGSLELQSLELQGAELSLIRHGPVSYGRESELATATVQIEALVATPLNRNPT